MKAIKIDAENRKVEEIEINGLSDMQKAVGGFIQVGHWFDNSNDVIFVDEEGLLKDPENFFTIRGKDSQILAGNGLVLGTNILTGAEMDAVTSIDYIKKNICWMDVGTMSLYSALMEIANS